MAALVKRGKTGRGSWVEVSLLESTLDLQFEVLTTWLNSGKQKPQRAKQGAAHAFLKAPYGVYETRITSYNVCYTKLLRSFAADLKNPEDLAIVKKLIGQADVMTHNFRPGVMEKIGLDYETAKALNPKLIYATVTGYGTTGPWVGKPGQDLLAQSISGLNHLTGDCNDTPTPMALAISDMYCGTHLTQGRNNFV